MLTQNMYMIQRHKYFISMRSYLFACNNMGAVRYLKQTEVDGKIPVNIHELWLKSDVCEDFPTYHPK